MTAKKELLAALTEATGFEKGMKEFYAFAVSLSGNHTAREIFGALRDMEDRHLRYLDFLSAAVMEGREPIGYKEYASTVTATHIERGAAAGAPQKVFDPSGVRSIEDAVKQAYAVEAKAAALYQRLAEGASDPKAASLFQEMVVQEQKHVEYLKNLEQML